MIKRESGAALQYYTVDAAVPITTNAVQLTSGMKATVAARYLLSPPSSPFLFEMPSNRATAVFANYAATAPTPLMQALNMYKYTANSTMIFVTHPLLTLSNCMTM
jgi:hypothetical protein